MVPGVWLVMEELTVADFQAIDDMVFAISLVFSDGVWIPLPWRWDYLQFNPDP